MQSTVATQRYLEHYIEPGLPQLSTGRDRWQNVLVVPAFAEPPDFLAALAKLRAPQGKNLLIVVLNRPNSEQDPTRNSALRQALHGLSGKTDTGVEILQLSRSMDVYLHDIETLQGPSPANEGVGLARKSGCDLAFTWIMQGAITNHWICCSDADTWLPNDYFDTVESLPKDSAAALFPFCHVAGDAVDIDTATALYELRIHHYVLGLEYAGSPYAFHTLGSCMAINAGAYAKCRGFPRRAGAEDFYLLNKLAKVGAITRLQGECIRITARRSTRVPFGTGPAVEQLVAAENMGDDMPYFYHPLGFEALRCLLLALPALYNPSASSAPACDVGVETTDGHIELATAMQAVGLNPELACKTQKAMEQLGWSGALQHCVRQARDKQQFMKQVHVWLDGFRTLRLLHLLREQGLPLRSLAQLAQDAPQLWPTSSSNAGQLRNLVQQRWGWQLPP
ncbi:MAG: hypothetical protein NXI15_12220 [Gammaproteobacteria bacterium]|nr:hypothetical protein [Gammaproteobacteria bacterium]